ncbi:MAG: glycyl-radical enzyme activating protein [Armatimonadota bacterium]
MAPDAREVTGTIFDIDETAIHDGPGVRMTVYLKGCPLTCVWCHSPESQRHAPEIVWFESRCGHCGACVNICPQRARRPGLIDPEDRARCILCGACVEACPAGAIEVCGREVTAGEIADRAQRLMPFFRRTGGGVTLTGGEPLSQPGFVYAIASLCRDADIHVALETCGFAPWETLERLAEVVDLWLYDVKHPDAPVHEELTGASNEIILANLRRLIEGGAEVLVRVPLIPGVNDDAETIGELARIAAGLGAARIELLPFNPATGGKYSWLGLPHPMPEARRQSPEAIARLAAICEQRGLQVL